MYCKYCGKSIDNDSIYCWYCGKQIEGERGNFKPTSMFCAPSKTNCESYCFSRIRITKEQLLEYLYFIWKVLKTIVIAIIGLIAYIFVGFIMSPFMALFSVEMPSLGIFDEIEKIWKKEKHEEDKEQK